MKRLGITNSAVSEGAYSSHRKYSRELHFIDNQKDIQTLDEDGDISAVYFYDYGEVIKLKRRSLLSNLKHKFIKVLTGL